MHAVTHVNLEGATDAYGSFALSNDGGLIAYEQRGAIFVKRTRGARAPLKVAEGSFPKWSPSGSRLAYYSSATGSLQLWIYNLGGGGVRPATALPGGVNPDPSVGLPSRGGALRYQWSPSLGRA